MTVGSSAARTVRRFFSKRGRGRESASFGAAALGVLLLAGAALGNGISRTAVEVSDGLTWLGDEQRGEVVQVNPASGRPETRLQVSGADALLDITQKDGMLVVLDRRTGQITVIDLSTLLASGRRQAPAGGSSKVLLAEGRLYIVDRAGGSVVNADPITLADIGAPWLAGQPLADAVTDEEGVLWVVDHGGNLRALDWSDEDNRFVEKSNRPVAGAGPRAALVPHRQGVTVLGLEGGVVLQDGTGADVRATTARQLGDVLAAQTSPSGLVPASIPENGTVVLVSGDEVLRVDVAGLGCARPGRPAVFHDKIYVPCRGTGRVVVLNRSGGRAGDDVRTGGSGDPQLVFDDGRLFINTPGAETGVIVDADGKTRSVVIRSPELQVTNPDRTPPPSPPSPPKPNPHEPTRTRPNQPTTTAPVQVSSVPAESGSPAPPTSVDPRAGVPGVPPGVTVSLVSRTAAEITIAVRWGAATAGASPVSGYAVEASGAFTGGSKSVQVTGTSTQLTLPCAGTQFCQNGRLDVAVTAVNQAGRGAAGSTVWAVPPPATTNPPPVTTVPNTPPPPTTTVAPPPVTTTTTPPPPPPPPPPSLPTAGAVVITGVSGTGYTRRLTMAPPADWANHNGTCEIVNKTWDYTEPVACSATSATIMIDEGINSIVVRAHAASGGASVDSASRSIRMLATEPCPGGRICQQPKVAADQGSTELSSGSMTGAGLGLIATAVLLRVGVRRREDEDEQR